MVLDPAYSLFMPNAINTVLAAPATRTGRSTVRTFPDHLDLELVTRDAGLAQVEVYFRDRSGLPMFKGYVTDLDPRRLAGCESALRAHYCAKIAAGY